MSGSKRTALARALAGVVSLLTIEAATATYGIKRLIPETRAEASRANDATMKGADQQRDLVKKKKSLRDSNQQLEKTMTPKPKGLSNAGTAAAKSTETKKRKPDEKYGAK